MGWQQMLFDGTGSSPRWNSGDWGEPYGQIQTTSDAILFLCYVATSVLLLWLRRNRIESPFSGVLSLFALFSFSCGLLHLLEAISIWHPLSALAKLTTAGTFVAALGFLLPRMLAHQAPMALIQAAPAQRGAGPVGLSARHERLECKVTEQTPELVLQRDRLELALQAGAMGLWEADLDAGRVSLDARAAVALDLSVEETRWEAVLERVVPSDSEKLREAAYAVLDSADHSATATVRVAQSDGPERTLEIHLASVGSNDRRRILAVTRNISEALETAARQRRLSEILEATTDLIATAKLDGPLVWRNAALRDWLALPCTSPGATATPQELARKLLGPNVELALREGSWSGEAVLSHNQQQLHVNQVVVAHKDADNNNAYVSAILSDTSALNNCASHLRQSESLLRAVFEAAPYAMAIVDGNDRVTLHNSALEELFGYAASELRELSLEVLVPDARQQGSPDGAQPTAGFPPRPKSRSWQRQGKHKGGASIPLDLELNPLQLKDSELTLATFVDSSERLQVDKELAAQGLLLRQANDDLTEFIYAASHDLQEPVRKVSSFCQLIELELGPSASPLIVEYLAFAVDGAQRMQVLIRDLLEYSRLQGSTVRLTTVSTERCVSATTEGLSQPISESGARIVSGNLPEVIGQEELLKKVFSNLIGNAILYRSPERPCLIKVGASPDGDLLRFHVSDNGIGIANKHAKRVFRPFERLHSGDEYPGTGLGLAIAKKSVERCGGRIWLETPGATGATILFTLQPAAPTVAREADAPSAKNRQAEARG